MRVLAALGVALYLCGVVARAQETTADTYAAAFFAEARPYSAFDMLKLVPGYTFDEGDSDLRGLASAAGNVLIDGDRPASKHESLETVLRRIPAASVSQIELIRPGTAGVDMQGQAVLANVVRVRGVRTGSAAEVGTRVYRDGLAPRVAAELSRRSDDRLLEASAARYRDFANDSGAGYRRRAAADGSLLREADYDRDEHTDLLELASGYEQAAWGGELRLNGSLAREDTRSQISEQRSFPEIRAIAVDEDEYKLGHEFALRYAREWAGGLRFEGVGIRHDLRERGAERELDPSGSSVARQEATSSESILRGILRHSGPAWTFEGGLEGAMNELDSELGLEENGVQVPLPAARVRVEERRAELSFIARRALGERWSLEAGSRLEVSEITQSGDSNLRRSFEFLKPRAQLSWTPDSQQQARLLLEREVGQLDFGDFVSSTSLSSDTVTAGNPELVPDRTWRAELSWERRFLQSGAVVVTARHEEITDLIDRIPVFGVEPFDGVGNIGDGRRDELMVDLNLPLRAIGITAGLLKANVTWRHSRATDPATGERRIISGDRPLDISASFQQDLPRWNLHWGVDVEVADKSSEYRFDELRVERDGTMVDVFVEYQPSPPWRLRLQVENITDRATSRERRIYNGVRGSAGLDYIEREAFQLGPVAGLTVRRTFGG